MVGNKLLACLLTALFALSPVSDRTLVAAESEQPAITAAPVAEIPAPETSTPSVGPSPTAEPTATLPPTATPSPEPAVLAEDITLECALNGYTGARQLLHLKDNVYKTYWESTKRNGVHSLRVTAPEGKTAGGILIRWKSWPLAVSVQVPSGDDWVTVTVCDADFVAQYIAIPDAADFRIISRDDEGQTKLEISEITVLTPGELPDDIQVWRKAEDKVDMLLIAGHPDDELLWFGGLLPTYAGEQGRDVLVACGAHNSYYRRLELCDGLWACGVNIYPEFLSYFDLASGSAQAVYKEWGGQSRVQGDIVRLYRQYRPDVVVLHADNGETGHGAHKALSLTGRDAIASAASAEEFPETAELYGTWLVPKVYLHLWEENQITMDWHVPLARFGGLNGMEVAAIAFEKHVSQHTKSYYSIHDGGDTDCSLFGLFHTTVGVDVEKQDMFEHITPRGE